MSTHAELMKAIRGGKLSEVIAVLDTGVSVEIMDGQGDPGLPLAIACFLGHAEIVRELLKRGAIANQPDNRVPTSPLSMALRGRRTEVVKVLVEFGTEIPDGVVTGLSEEELALARWKAQICGEGGMGEPVIEEIQMTRCYGTDTVVLEADVLRAAREIADKAEREKAEKKS